MKIIYPLLFLTFFLSCNNGKESKPYSKSDKKQIPTQHLFFARSFPDNTLDIKALKKAYQAHHFLKKQSEYKNNGVQSPWRIEGPNNIGGRLNTVAIHPQNPDIIYTGASTGGIFKTSDAGQTWSSVSDDFDYLAIGDLVIDPINHDIVYAATGDPNITLLPHPGNGLYKSEDAGETWINIGLEDAGIIAEVAVNPNNNQIIFAASMGLPFEESNDRGLYRSLDGGQNWEQVLFVSDDAGIIDIVMNPNNPDIIFAAAWDRIRNNTESVIYEDDSKIYRSIDGGDNWTLLTDGLPTFDQGRIGLDISQQNPNKVYALYVGQDSHIQGIYKSENSGNTWTSINSDPITEALGGFGWYFGKIRVNPYNDNEISVLGVDLHTTYNEGFSWEQSTPDWWTYEVHADKHDLVYYSPNVRYLATDGGLYRNDNQFNSDWEDIEDLPNTQFYRIAVDPFNPGIYAGGAQDNGTTSGSFQNPVDWPRIYGGDGFQPIYDPIDPNLFYAETQRGGLVYNDGFGFESFTNGIEPSDRRFWDMPIIMSSWDNARFYTGTYRIYKNEFGPYGDWFPISEDLTNGDVLGGSFNTISTVAESPLNEDILYAGTTDGNVWYTTDGGDNWTEVSAGLPERFVTNIKASLDNPNSVFVCHNGYKDNDNISHIHFSNDNGNTWIDISGDLPEIPINHIEMISDQILFIATEVGVYFTENQGENWNRIGNNMPLIPVFDIEIEPFENRLVAGTFARSIWSFPLDSLFNDPIGVPENMSSQQIKLFPNPSSDFIHLESTDLIRRAEIYDLNGRQIKTIETDLQRINIGDLVSGNYILRIEGIRGWQNVKFIKD